MFYLIDHIAALTDARDRESLDSTLASLMMELLEPVSVMLCMVVSDASDRRWLPRSVMYRGQRVEVNDVMHADFQSLAPVEQNSPRGRCLEDNLPVVMEDFEGERGTFLTCLPLSAGRGPDETGIIEIRSTRRLDAQAMATIERALRIYRNMHSMFMYSERDALTGLLNRKSFDDTFYRSIRDDQGLVADAVRPDGKPIDDRWHRRRRLGESHWLAMIDVDHFKQVNDQYGHQIGDEVLILVGRILKSTFRGYDRVYRFGGEEFVVLMRSPDSAAALQAADRFRQKMEQYRFPQVGRITVSLGLSSILAGDAPDVVCSRADQAVYYAKRHGRNRACSFDDLLQQGLLQSDVRDGGVELF